MNHPTCETCEHWEFKPEPTDNPMPPSKWKRGLCSKLSMPLLPSEELFPTLQDFYCAVHSEIEKWEGE